MISRVGLRAVPRANVVARRFNSTKTPAKQGGFAEFGPFLKRKYAQQGCSRISSAS